MNKKPKERRPENVQISISLRKSTLERIDALAKSEDRNRSKQIERLLLAEIAKWEKTHWQETTHGLKVAEPPSEYDKQGE